MNLIWFLISEKLRPFCLSQLPSFLAFTICYLGVLHFFNYFVSYPKLRIDIDCQILDISVEYFSDYLLVSLP